jgi:hypothetical protein
MTRNEHARAAAEAFARRVADAAEPRPTDTNLIAGDALGVLVGLAVSYAQAMHLDLDDFLDAAEDAFVAQAVARGRIILSHETAEA